MFNKKMKRFILQQSKDKGWWLCTDASLSLVLKWHEGEFNDTQKVTHLADTAGQGVMVYARAIRGNGRLAA